MRYGDVQVLFGVDFAVRRGRDRRPARHERRRQVDAAQGDIGRRPGRPGARCGFDGHDITNVAPERDRRARHRPGARRPRGVPVAHRRREPPGRRLAAPQGPGHPTAPRTDEVLEPVPGPGRPARRSRRPTSPAVSNRCWRCRWRSSASRSCWPSTSCRSVWRRWSSSSCSTWCGRSATRAPPSILVEQSVNVALTSPRPRTSWRRARSASTAPTAELLERPDVLRSVFLKGADEGLAGDRRSRRSTLAVADHRLAGPAPGTTARPPARAPALAVDQLSVRFGGIQCGRRRLVLGRGGRGGRAHRPERRRQDDPARSRSRASPRPTAVACSSRGRRHRHVPRHRRAALGLGRSFQDSRLFPSLTVEETLLVALERWLDVRDPLNAAFRLPAFQDSEAAAHHRVDELIDLMGIESFRTKFIGELSTGSRRVVDLACVLAHEPTVVLLDEPSSGIAQREAEALGPLLLRIRDVLGASLVVIEHDMTLITAVSDRLIALDQGAVVAERPTRRGARPPRGGRLLPRRRSGDRPLRPRVGASRDTAGRCAMTVFAISRRSLRMTPRTATPVPARRAGPPVRSARGDRRGRRAGGRPGVDRPRRAEPSPPPAAGRIGQGRRARSRSARHLRTRPRRTGRWPSTTSAPTVTRRPAGSRCRRCTPRRASPHRRA